MILVESDFNKTIYKGLNFHFFPLRFICQARVSILKKIWFSICWFSQIKYYLLIGYYFKKFQKIKILKFSILLFFLLMKTLQTLLQFFFNIT